MDSITKCVKAKMRENRAKEDMEKRGIYKTNLPTGKNAPQIIEIDKEIEELAEYRKVPKLSTREKLIIDERLEQLKTILIKLGDKGGRCSWCLRRIIGKHYKVKSVDRTRLSREETIWDSCKQCSDEFKAWAKRSKKWLEDPNSVFEVPKILKKRIQLNRKEK